MVNHNGADDGCIGFEKTAECNTAECPTCGWTSPMGKGPARECVEPEEGLRFEDEHGNPKRVVKVFRCGGKPYKVRVVNEETGAERDLGRHFLNKCWASRFHRGEWKVEREEPEILADGGVVVEEREGSKVCTGHGVTIYHPRHAIKGAVEDMSEAEIRATQEVEFLVGRKEHDLTPAEFRGHYRAAETVLGTTDLGEAYEAAQGPVVNREQGGRHMVCSCSVGHVMLVHKADGSHEYHAVEPIGFRELETLTEEARP